MLARIAILMAAPHRLLFLVGVLNFAFLMIWWTATLFSIYIRPLAIGSENFPVSLQHAPVMLFLMIPAFFFGFLLTVFPRWTGYPDLEQKQYAPIGCAFIVATLLAWYALVGGNHHFLAIALGVAGLGWIAALWHMIVLLVAERRDRKGPTWHAWSAFAALCCGLTGLGFAVRFLMTQDGAAYLIANHLGTFGFLLPVFLTVAHRMIPFFASNSVKDYVSWRPYWVLALIWIFLLAHLLSVLIGHVLLQFISALALSVLAIVMLWRWWPRQQAPGLLMVLIWGFAWTPIGFALIAAGNFAELAGYSFALGLAPVHALYIGMSGSLIIAMVTRVTQGHSGRPLKMNRMAWLAFWGIQMSAIARIIAGVRHEHGHWLVLAGVIWIILVMPWAMRQARIYLLKRADHKAG